MAPNKMWIAYSGLVYKECARWLRIWPQSLLPSAITMALYFMIFGGVIGHRVGLMENIPYMQFIAPGLIMMAIITNSYSNVVSSFYGVRFVRSVEELLVSPMPNWLIIAGYVTGGVLRGLAVGIIVTLVGSFFTGLHIHHLGLAIATALVSAVLFSLAGFINGVFARKFDDTAIITTFVLTPLIYLGGVFYSIQLLPPFWRGLSMANPIHYVIELFRYTYLGLDTPIGVVTLLIIVIAFAAALFLLAWWLLSKGVRVKS